MDINEQPFRESTTPLLRPQQVKELTGDARQFRDTLTDDPAQRFHRSAVTANGKKEAAKQLKRISRDLSQKAPKPYVGMSLDLAIKREEELRAEWMLGMPTQAEMRRNPAGAVDKHTDWERRNKPKILEWKNVRLRLAASGALKDRYLHTDAANIEMYRPAGGPGEMNMHNTQIAGTQYFLPPPGSAAAIVFSDEEIAKLKSMGRDGVVIAAQLALMDASARAQVKEILMGVDDDEAIEEATRPDPSKDGRKTLTLGGAKT